MLTIQIITKIHTNFMLNESNNNSHALFPSKSTVRDFMLSNKFSAPPLNISKITFKKNCKSQIEINKLPKIQRNFQ